MRSIAILVMLAAGCGKGTAADAGGRDAPAGRQAERRIVIDLGRQSLRMIEGGRVMQTFDVSTGPGGETPGGTFRVWRKNRMKDMKVGLVTLGKYYTLKNVPYIMYIEGEAAPRSRGFAIHGAYWHDDFGKPVSHGCVNMSVEDAETLFFWTGPAIGALDEVLATDSDPGTPVEIVGRATGR